ncbi:MAG: TonB family protein [Planctomycetes bacterium]|nr:TonB family protein [Planctomycetota bacterium]
MRPSLLVLSIVLHGTAIGAAIGFGAYAREQGPTPPARIEIQTTQAAVPAPPPVPVPPVEAEQVEVEADVPDMVLFDEVEPAAPETPPVDRELPADRLSSQPLARVRTPQQEPQPPTEVERLPEVEVPPDAVAQPAAPSAPPQEFVEAQRADNAPPRYPERERRLRHEGAVVLAVSVAADGEVVEVAVRRPSRHEAFNREAVRAARGWRFSPARERGEPVASVTEITVEFRLEDA